MQTRHLALVACAIVSVGAAPTPKNLRATDHASFPSTFGSAGKAVSLAPAIENELYNHTCGKSLCMLRHMWFGGSWDGYDVTRLRVYVDGEVMPSIDGQLFLLHGIGWADASGPWSSGALFGKTGDPSGVFNTFQIPFSASIRITAQTNIGTAQRFWWIFRGTEGDTSVMLGQQPLPDAARLRLHTAEAVQQPVLSQHVMFSTERAGAVLMSTLSVGAASENFLEGEVRLYQHGIANSSCSYGVCASVTISSGTEDYFLGTYYFNKGMYHTPLAGLTHLVAPNQNGTKQWQFSAYRRHDATDHVFFGSGGTQMTWRCGEPGAGSPTDCSTSSYVLVYEW